MRRDLQDVAGVQLKVFSAGEGPEVLVLHRLSAFTADAPLFAGSPESVERQLRACLLMSAGSGTSS